MKSVVVNTYLLCLLLRHVTSDTHDETEVASRHARFWPVGFVRFANSICSTLEGLEGTCYTREQCDGINGGIVSGKCANGIGRCCLVQRTCGSTSSYNNTYFVNSNYPNGNPAPTQCVYTIRKCNSDICQVRLDFLALSLAQPDGNGYCVTDSVQVVGGASTVPIICGENSGQHMYVYFNGDSDIKIIVSANSIGRSWSIKVAQIGCDCPWKAPTGCLQYFTSLTGTVNNFNYGTGINGNLVTQNIDGNDQPIAVPGTRQMANENYGVCVQMQPGYCSIKWSQGSDSTSFTVNNSTALQEAIRGLPGDPLKGENCTTDYVVVPNPHYTNGTAIDADRFCGNQFIPLVSSSKPFVLTVVTNKDEVGDVANRGFSLNYEQQACGTDTSSLSLALALG
ncbi:uncharacterized protein LOC109598852 [Aethina tumida]|uniref:uncharacterized protein LOC109598852 n=1 Tax=Aethina tumida TaxID=116153 RepID=UPI0021493977|nr:uncharacterized protein LOC109598852 [Aethina tumida]